MGQVQSSSVDFITGQNDNTSSPLTSAEKDFLESQQCIFDCFFRNPTFENYKSIRVFDELYKKCLGRNYDVFCLAMREKNPSFDEPLDDAEKSFLQAENQRLMAKESQLSASDLDTLWILYYATGSKEFPDRVLYASNDFSNHLIIRLAAEWSYNSHKQQGKLL